MKHTFKANILLSLTVICCNTLANMAPGGFNKFKSKYFVETGTYAGRGIEQALKAGFEVIYSIELDRNFYRNAQNKFRHLSNIHLVLGDSGSILYETIKDIDEKIVFWLDGHNGVYDPHGENTPLLRELDQIKKHHIKTHTILIDDMHCTEKPLFDFLTKEDIIAKIKEINPDYQIRYIPGGDQAEYPENVMVAEIKNN